MSSAKPTDAVPQARVIDQEAARQRTWALLRRLIAGGAIAVGWGFIAWHNHFHLTPSVPFLALGWLSVVLGVLYVWQTTVATADPADEQAAWPLELDDLLAEGVTDRAIEVRAEDVAAHDGADQVHTRPVYHRRRRMEAPSRGPAPGAGIPQARD